MAIERLVSLPLASLEPRIWTEPAVEGGRTTVDGSLTALSRPVYLRPPDGVTEGGASITPLQRGSSNSSAAPHSGSPSGAKQPGGIN